MQCAPGPWYVAGSMRVRTLLLASASPRRRALLEAIGHRVHVKAVDVDEAELPGEQADAYLARIVDAKLAAGRALAPPFACDALLVADTAVIVDRHGGQAILQKPASDAEGAAMLRALGGRAHRVTTRFALATPDGRTHVESVTTAVLFRALDDDEIAAYVRSGEGRDKAGGYAIQGRAASFVVRIDGSYGAVVGLPSCEVELALRRLLPGG
ncbi:MAG: nucleoside triphosphate pyrophosphatase [Polyangiales bacterium]